MAVVILLPWLKHPLVSDVRLGVFQWAPWILFTSTLMEGGDICRWSGAALAGYLLGVFAVILKRREYGSRTDRAFVRWGYFPLMILGLAISPLVHHYIRW